MPATAGAVRREPAAAHPVHDGAAMKLVLAPLFSGLALAIALLATGGCDDIDRAFDCSKICNRYQDCFDGNYDVDTCVDRCEDNAGDSEDFDQHADDCESCIDDRSCNESFACALDCVGIVP
jgi:hypothetical protein